MCWQLPRHQQGPPRHPLLLPLRLHHRLHQTLPHHRRMFHEEPSTNEVPEYWSGVSTSSESSQCGRIRTALFGSFTRTNFPASYFFTSWIKFFRIPQQFCMFKLICCANSVGLNICGGEIVRIKVVSSKPDAHLKRDVFSAQQELTWVPITV